MKLNSMIEPPTIQKSALIVFFSIMGVIIHYKMLLQPQQKMYAARKYEESRLKKEFEQKQEIESKISNSRLYLDALKNQLMYVLRFFPSSHTVSRLMDNILKLAKKNNLSVNLFVPQHEIKHDVYIELPVITVIKGDYNHLVMFLSQINQFPYIITFDDITITKLRKKKNRLLSSNQLLTKIKFKLYQSNDSKNCFLGKPCKK